MTSRSAHNAPLSILSIKGVLARVQGGQLSMRSLTAAIRSHCLDGHTHTKDALLSFFLNCQSKLRRSTQQEWNRVIEHQIRRMVGLETIGKFMLKKASRITLEALRQGKIDGDAVPWELQGLGEMEISEEVHLKTRYFCNWLQFLQERREIKRLKNKQVEDLRKSQLFSQYSLKFQSFLHWKQHARKAKSDRAKAEIIQKAVINRISTACFAAFKEKIDIIAIQAQLAQAVSSKLVQGAVKSVFGKLRDNRHRQKGRALKDMKNIWAFRFYRHLTQRLAPLHTLTASRNRHIFSKKYQQLGVRLCWKGIRIQVQQTNTKIALIRNIRRINSTKQFLAIQKRKKVGIIHKEALLTLRRGVVLKELMENIESGSQNSLQYAQKIASVQLAQKNSAARSFLSIFSHKAGMWKHLQTSKIKLYKHLAISNKRKTFTSLRVFHAKRGQYAVNVSKAQSAIAIRLFVSRARQYQHQKVEEKSLYDSLAQRHNKHLIKMAIKSMALYRSVSLNQYQTMTAIIQSVRLKQVRKTFDQLRQKSQLASRLHKLITRSQFIALKSSFVTILNRMLSSKMKIKAFYSQQDKKLKAKLLQLLKRNSEFMHGQREAVFAVALHFAKRRLIANMKKEASDRRHEEQLQGLRERTSKQRFFGVLTQGSVQRDQLYAKESETRLMLACSAMSSFIQSAREFLQYRQNQAKLTYKLQKTLVKGVFKNIKKKVVQQRQQKQERKELQVEHAEKIRRIQIGRASNELLRLLRANPYLLRRKQRQIRQKRYIQVLSTLASYQKQRILKKSLKITLKDQFISILRSQWTINKQTLKLNKRLNKESIKRSLVSFQQSTIQQASQRQDKQVLLSQWLQQSRSVKSKQVFVSNLASHAEIKENFLILANTVLKNSFQRMLRQYLSRRSCAIKDVIALRLYASNLKRRALRGLRRATDVQVLKENRAKTQQNSKLSLQKSIQHVRRRSKLMETIERYNHSRISRVVR